MFLGGCSDPYPRCRALVTAARSWAELGLVLILTTVTALETLTVCITVLDALPARGQERKREKKGKRGRFGGEYRCSS